jgi:hypothetical protein
VLRHRAIGLTKLSSDLNLEREQPERPTGEVGRRNTSDGRMRRSEAMGDCLACDLTSGALPLPGEVIFETSAWRVEHCVGPLGVGTLS